MHKSGGFSPLHQFMKTKYSLSLGEKGERPDPADRGACLIRCIISTSSINEPIHELIQLPHHRLQDWALQQHKIQGTGRRWIAKTASTEHKTPRVDSWECTVVSRDKFPHTSSLTASQKHCFLGFRFLDEGKKEKYFSETICHSWKEFAITAMLFFVLQGEPARCVGNIGNNTEGTEYLQCKLLRFSCAYLCTAAVCSSFAWGRTASLYPEVQGWILQGAARCCLWDHRDVKQMPADFAEQRTENWTGGKREPPAGRRQPSSLLLPAGRHSEVAVFTPAALFQSLFTLSCSTSRYTQVCPRIWRRSVANWSWLRDLQVVICSAQMLSVCWACPLTAGNKMQTSLLDYFTVFLLFCITRDSTAIQAGRQMIHLPPQRQRMPSPSPVLTGQYHLALLRKPSSMRKGRRREAHTLMRTLPFLGSCKCIRR